MKTGPIFFTNTTFHTTHLPSSAAPVAPQTRSSIDNTQSSPSYLQRIWNILESVWKWVKNLFCGSTQTAQAPAKPEPIDLEERANTIVKAIHDPDSFNSESMPKTWKALSLVQKDGKTIVVNKGTVQKETASAYAQEESQKLFNCLSEIGPHFKYECIWVGKNDKNQFSVGRSYVEYSPAECAQHWSNYMSPVKLESLPKVLNISLPENEQSALLKFLAE